MRARTQAVLASLSLAAPLLACGGGGGEGEDDIGEPGTSDSGSTSDSGTGDTESEEDTQSDTQSDTGALPPCEFQGVDFDESGELVVPQMGIEVSYSSTK